LEANDRRRFEQLCRGITRPALSDEQVQFNAAGQVELKLKTPWRDLARDVGGIPRANGCFAAINSGQ
jgi:hypothetical protein